MGVVVDNGEHFARLPLVASGKHCRDKQQGDYHEHGLCDYSKGLYVIRVRHSFDTLLLVEFGKTLHRKTAVVAATHLNGHDRKGKHDRRGREQHKNK